MFVTVHAMRGDRRLNGEFARGRACFIEADDAAGEPTPIEPTFSIESSPGKRHDYFVAGEPLDEATTSGLQARMIETHGSDPNAADLARVLRLAGSWHQKAEPHRVRIIEAGGREYSAAELVEAFPPIEVKPKVAVRPSRPGIEPLIARDVPPHIAARMEARKRGEAPSKWRLGFKHPDVLADEIASAPNRSDARFNPDTRDGCRNFAFAVADAIDSHGLDIERGWGLYLAHVAQSPKFGTGQCDEAGNRKLFDDIVRRQLESGTTGGITLASLMYDPTPATAFTAQAPTRSGDIFGSAAPARPRALDGASLIKFPTRAKPNYAAASYIIKGVVGARWLTAFFGPSGSAKSFVVGEGSYLVALGKPAFGRRVQRTPVLYVCLEGEDDFANSRVQLWRRVHGDAGDWFAMMAVSPSLAMADATCVGAQQIIAAVEHMKSLHQAGTVLVVIDTVARAMAGDDENAAPAMTGFVNKLKMISDATGAATAIVHHSGKDATKGMRGSSSLFAACDAVVSIDAAPDDAQGEVDGLVRRVRVDKLKSGEVGPWFDFVLKQHQLGVDRDGDLVTSCTVEPIVRAQAATSILDLSDDEREVFEALTDELTAAGATSEASIPLTALRRAVYRRWTGKEDTKRRGFNRARKSLDRLGVIGQHARGVWCDPTRRATP